MTEQVPLIWTSKGNLPEASLRMEVQWIIERDYIKLVKRHYLDDELVKEGADIYSRVGMVADSSVGQVL